MHHYQMESPLISFFSNTPPDYQVVCRHKRKILHGIIKVTFQESHLEFTETHINSQDRQLVADTMTVPIRVTDRVQ